MSVFEIQGLVVLYFFFLYFLNSCLRGNYVKTDASADTCDY